MAVSGAVSENQVLALPSVPTVELDLDSLHPSPFQPRRHPSLPHLEALAASIRQLGLLEPLCVRPLSAGSYQIIAGESRWRAARLADLSRVPCRLYHVSEDQAFLMALAENLQRHALSPLEEALSYQQMLDRGIAKNRAAIARLLGVSRPRITQRMKLLDLDPVTQQLLEDHPALLTELHGRLLWEVKSLADRHALAHDAIARRWSGARLRAAVEEYLRESDVAAWRGLPLGLPRAYHLSYPGFRLSINFRCADHARVLASLRRLVEHWESLSVDKS